MEQFDRINSRAREMFLIYPKKKKKQRDVSGYVRFIHHL